MLQKRTDGAKNQLILMLQQVHAIEKYRKSVVNEKGLPSDSKLLILWDV